MSATHKFELALHLKTLRNIGVRQTCFLQVRTIVFHKNDKKQNLTAKPYEIINLGQTEQSGEENLPVLEDDTYLTQKFLVKHTDRNVSMNSLCLFKGQIEISRTGKWNHELYIYSELIWYMGKEMEVVGEWKGYTKLTSFDSYMDIYFSSHILTCSIEADVHCILSEINIKNEEKIIPVVKNSSFYNHIVKKDSQIYEAAIDPLINSYNLLVSWLKEFTRFHLTQLQNKEKTLLIDLNRSETNWKYNRLSKDNSKLSEDELKEMINSLSNELYLQNLQADSHNISLNLYILWKDFLNLFKRFPESHYFLFLKQNYHKRLQKDHWMNRIIVIGENEQPIKQVFEPEVEELQFCSVEQHISQIKLSCNDMRLLSKPITKKKNRIIVLVHGFQASSFDMEIIAMYFKFRNPQCHILISETNEGMTEGVIEQCGHRLAVEIKNYINARELKDFSISFIGHSLGGIIIRASLRYLQLYKNSFECFISICSPHMGYLYHTSKIVTTSMWIMNQLKKDQSMIQLTMSDNKVLNKCYIYELSERGQLAWFKTVILMGSKQDEYVPFSSALLQNMDFFIESQSAKVYQTMYNNIMKPIQNKVVRLEIIFNDKVKDLSGFIGRTAHIKVLSFLPIIDLYCHLISKRI